MTLTIKTKLGKQDIKLYVRGHSKRGKGQGFIEKWTRTKIGRWGWGRRLGVEVGVGVNPIVHKGRRHLCKVSRVDGPVHIMHLLFWISASTSVAHIYVRSCLLHHQQNRNFVRVNNCQLFHVHCTTRKFPKAFQGFLLYTIYI